MLETIFDKRFEILGLGTTWNSEEQGENKWGRSIIPKHHYSENID